MYRRIYKNTIAYTYIRYNAATRIDRFYSNIKYHENTTITYKQLAFTDHSNAPILTLNFTKFLKWGKSTWKINNSILEAQTNKDQIWYTWMKWREQKSKFENIIEWWEKGKIKIKNECINIAINENRRKNDREKTLRKDLMRLVDYETNDLYMKTKSEIAKIEHDKNEGQRIRARIKQYIEDEKPTKYFYKKEIKNKMKTQINEIQLENGSKTKDPNKIEKEVLEHFQNIWGIEPETDDEIQNDFINLMTESLQDRLEESITITEIENEIENLNNNAAPGSGLSGEFYKTLKTQ